MTALRAEHTAAYVPVLTGAEQRVLEMLADGYEILHIAHTMGLAERTIKNYTDTLRAKLYARNRTHLIAQAYRRGLLAIDPDEAADGLADIRAQRDAALRDAVMARTERDHALAELHLLRTARRRVLDILAER